MVRRVTAPQTQTPKQKGINDAHLFGFAALLFAAGRVLVGAFARRGPTAGSRDGYQPASRTCHTPRIPAGRPPPSPAASTRCSARSAQPLTATPSEPGMPNSETPAPAATGICRAARAQGRVDDRIPVSTMGLGHFEVGRDLDFALIATPRTGFGSVEAVEAGRTSS